MQNIKRKKVILLVPVLAHYRRDVYKFLSQSDDYEFIFVAGKNYQNIESYSENNSITFSYLSFTFFHHRFYFLKGALRKILSVKPRIIISSGVDFHLIHSVFLFIIQRLFLRKEFYWWSQGTSGHQGKIGWILRKVVYRLSSGVLLYSQAGKSNLLRMNVKPEKLQVVGNCLNVEDYGYLNYSIPELKNKTEEFTILFSGRITDKVHFELLIRALGQFAQKGNNNFKCYVIGQGDIDKYRTIAKDCSIEDKICFLGPLYGKSAHEYFLKSDLFVYPGSIGLSILHALSFGLPVITTDDFSSHFPEIELLKVGENGDVYKNGDSGDLANKIEQWAGKIETFKDHYVSNCISRIIELNYTPGKVSESVLSLLSSI